jgi:hypothetical protein
MTRPRFEEEGYEIIHQQRECDAEGCKNIVTHWAQPKGYTGPVYCRVHAHLAEEKK